MDDVAMEACRVYGALGEAMVKGDLEALAALFTDDFTKVNLDGKTYSRDEWASALRRQFDAVSYHDAHCQIDKVTIDGETGHAYITKRFAGSRPNGTRFHSIVQSHDTLRLVDSEWRISGSDTFTLNKVEHEAEGSSPRNWRSAGKPLVVEELATTKAMEQMNGSPI